MIFYGDVGLKVQNFLIITGIRDNPCINIILETFTGMG